MSIFAISDLHLSTVCEKPMNIFGSSWENYMEEITRDWAERVTKDDTVLLGGDLSWGMTMEEAAPDIELIARLPGNKIMVRGNHDYWWSSVSKVRAAFGGEIMALQNDAVRVDGAIICGCRGWTVPDGAQTAEDKKIYERELIRMEMALTAAKNMRQSEEQLIVLTHFPPFNVHRADSGFTRLFIEYGVDKVVYGHLHGRDCRSDLRISLFGMEFFLTSCDLTGNRLVLIKE